MILKKSVLVIGLGKFGKNLVVKLKELGHDIMAIDIDESAVEDVLEYTGNALIGDCTDIKFVKRLGVSNFDLCIVSIGDNFQSSLETCSLLDEEGAKFVVARATDDVHEKFLLRNGADKVVYPNKQLAYWTAIRYSMNSIMEYFEIDSEFSMFEINVPKSWIGKSLIDLKVRQKFDVNVMALRINGKLCMDISGDTKFGENQTMLVLGKTKDITKGLEIE